MLAGCVVTVPLGTYALTGSDPEVFRWGVSGLALALVVLLVSGWRHHVEFGPKGLAGVGAASGFPGRLHRHAGGRRWCWLISAGSNRPERVRADGRLLFMLSFVAILGMVFALRGVLAGGGLALGVLLIPAYVAGNLAGQALFRPEMARTYRAVAYLVLPPPRPLRGCHCSEIKGACGSTRWNFGASCRSTGTGRGSGAWAARCITARCWWARAG